MSVVFSSSREHLFLCSKNVTSFGANWVSMKSQIFLQRIANLWNVHLYAETQPWLFIRQHLTILLSPWGHCCLFNLPSTQGSHAYFELSGDFCWCNDEEKPDWAVKMDGVVFPWKTESLTVKILHIWMHEGSCVCLCSASDGQSLFGKRSCYKPRGVDPSSLVKRALRKTNSRKRHLNSKQMHAWLLQLRSSLPSEIKPGLGIGAASMHQRQQWWRDSRSLLLLAPYLQKSSVPRLSQTIFHVSDVKWLICGVSKQNINYVFASKKGVVLFLLLRPASVCRAKAAVKVSARFSV